jgi:hypothetical protein
MGHWQRRITPALLLALPAAAQAATVVLPYHENNKWVAPAENAGLKALMAQAHNGVVFFRVALPKENRTLAVERLVIVRDLLAREAKQAVVMEEAPNPARAQTLAISY